MILDFRPSLVSSSLTHSPSPGSSYRLIPDGLSPYPPNWVGFIRTRLSMNRTRTHSTPSAVGRMNILGALGPAQRSKMRRERFPVFWPVKPASPSRKLAHVVLSQAAFLLRPVECRMR